MNRWLVVTAFATGTAIGAAGLGGCSGKVDSGMTSAKSREDTSLSQKAEQKTEPVSRPFMSTDQRYTHALNLFDQGSYDEAEKEFEIVCEQWPKFSKPFKHLARTQLKLGKYEEALENALTAAELNPKDGTIDNVLGLAYMEIDDYDSAESSFRSAITKAPTFAWAYNNLGYLKIQKKEFTAAKEVLLEGSKLGQAPAVLFNNLGIALEETGDTVAAKEAFAKAVDLDPTHDKASTNLSRLETPMPAGKEQEITQLPENQ